MVSYKVNIKTEDCDFINPNPPIVFPYNLDIFQKNAVNSIEEGNHVLVTAHTSAGKSTVAEYAISKALSEGKKIVYTSPIKTLSNQKYFDFKLRYNSVGILTGDIKENPEAECIVMTTEILRNMLFRASDFISQLGYVIFDEIHYINDRDRGHVWEETIVMLPPEIKLIMLSATISNSKLFANWISNIKKHNVDLISTPYRPVPLKHYIYHNNDIHLILNQKNGFDSVKYQEIYGHYKKQFKNYKSYKSDFNDFIKFIKDRDLFPCIFFSFSRKKCEEYAKCLVPNLTSFDEVSEITKIISKYMSGMFKDYLKLEQTVTLTNLLQKGYGFHHSGLVHPLKEIQEILFSKGLIKILFATETFSVGVNMPTRTVVFTELSKYDGHENSLRNLNTSEYIQMAGRSGRRGMDANGTVIYYPIKNILETYEIKSMMLGSTTKILSKLKLNTQFLLKVLQSSNYDILDFINESLLGKEDDKLETEYNDILKNIENKSKFLEMIRNKEEVEKYFGLLKSIESCKGNKRKKIEREIRNLKQDKKIMADINIQLDYNNLLEESIKLKKNIDYNNLHFELEISKGYLMDVGFINKTCKNLNELDKSDLTRKGLIGSEINECNEILLTQIIDNNLLDELSVEEICGILGIFIESKEDNQFKIVELEISDKAKYVLNRISEINIYLDEIAIKHNIDYNPYITLNSVMVVYQWAKGDSLRDIYLKNSLELYEGNFVKNITKVLNICNEIIHICEVIGKNILVEKLQNIESLLLRDIVSFDSIYVNNIPI